MRSDRKGPRGGRFGTVGRPSPRYHPAVRQRGDVYVSGRVCRGGRSGCRAGFPGLQNAAGAGTRTGPGSGAPDAAGRGPGLRPDGGRPHLVADGGTKLLGGHRGATGRVHGRRRYRGAGRAPAAGRSRRLPAIKREGHCSAGGRRTRTERTELYRPDRDAVRGLCANGRLLPGRFCLGPAPPGRNFAAGLELRLP